MAGEYWRQIEAEWTRLEKEQREKDRLKKLQRDREDRDTRHRDAKREKNYRLEESRRREKTEAAVGELWKIFKDLKSNSPEIRKVRLRSLVREKDVITLKWGSKFELTPSERAFINSHRRARFFSTEDIPEFIQDYAFYRISASVEHLGYNGLGLKQYYNSNWFDTSEFLKKPEIIFPTLLKYIKNPALEANSYNKGVGYWASRAMINAQRRPIPPSYDNNCCCT